MWKVYKRVIVVKMTLAVTFVLKLVCHRLFISAKQNNISEKEKTFGLKIIKKMNSAGDENVNFLEVCRICMQNGTDLVCIFNTKHETKTMANMLSVFLQKSVYENDGRPSNMCLTCIPKLIEAYELLDKATQSEQFFQRIICSTINNPPIPTVQDTFGITEFDENVADPLDGCSVRNEQIHISMPVIKTENLDETFSNEANTTAIQTPPDNTEIVLKTKRKSANNSNKKRHANDVFECYICHRQPFTRQSIIGHMAIHDIKKPFKCEICGMLHRFERDLDYHLCEGEEVICEYCPEVFHTTKAMLKHLEVHKETFLMYRCFRCRKSFNMNALSVWHDMRHERFQFECGICGKKYETKQTLINHTRFVHSNARPHVCTECGRGFKDRSSLKKHLIIHSDEKPFTCPECPKRYRWQGGLTIHLTTHRNEKHVCRQCGFIAQSKHKLRDHQKTHIETETTKLNVDESKEMGPRMWHDMQRHRFSFVCNICGKKFRTKTTLGAHLRFVHTDERPFVCTQCGLGFKDSSALKKHAIVHSEERPFACPECPCQFRRRPHLTTHQRKFHGEQEIPDTNRAMEQEIVFTEVKIEIPTNQEISTATENADENAEINNETNANEEFLDIKIKSHEMLCSETEIVSDQVPTNQIILPEEYRINPTPQLTKPFKRKTQNSSGDTQRDHYLYDCNICGKKFGRANILSAHKRFVHSENRPHVCDECGMGFKEKSALKKHKIVHSDEMPFVCACSRRFRRLGNLTDHQKNCRPELKKPEKTIQNREIDVRNETSIEMTIVPSEVPTDEVLAEEIDVDKNQVKNTEETNFDEVEVVPAEIRPNQLVLIDDDRIIEAYECYICKRQKPTLKQMKKHVRGHEITISFKCSVCGEQCSSAHRLNQHLCQDTEVTCEYCPVICRSTTEMLQHLEQHKNDFLFYNCFRCFKTFNMQILHSWHEIQHDRWTFICEICNKKFGTKRTLTNHKRFVHTKERPFLCAECGMGFKQKCALKKHATVHSNISKLKPFKCSMCPRSFPRQGSLKKHMDTHVVEKHVCLTCGVVKNSLTSLRSHQKTHMERTKECEVCGHKFFTNDRLRTHMRKHTGEKPFSCDHCSVAYAQKNDLVKHLRTHIGENTYVCEKCDMSFRYYAELRKHLDICGVAAPFDQPTNDEIEVPSTSAVKP